MAVLYHGSFVMARHEVVRLFERLGGFRFVTFCPLVSTFFAGLLSVMLSALSSCLLNCGLFGLPMASYFSGLPCIPVKKGCLSFRYQSWFDSNSHTINVYRCLWFMGKNVICCEVFCIPLYGQ
jgi:hypothetical protein